MLGFRELYVVEYPRNSKGSWSVISNDEFCYETDDCLKKNNC